MSRTLSQNLRRAGVLMALFTASCAWSGASHAARAVDAPNLSTQQSEAPDKSDASRKSDASSKSDALLKDDETLVPIKVPPASTRAEIEMGKKAVEQIAKDPKIKLLDANASEKNKALLKKLNDMAKTLGKVSARPLIVYKVNVIEDKDLNAFTVPDGYIYLTTGLIEIAGSDDEIAAVIAHEIGHNARMHVVRHQRKVKPLQWVSLAAMAAMMTGSEAGANVARMAPYVLTGIANSYGIEYEKEADKVAIDEMKRTDYNPSAMVTFMQRLREEERRRPEMELGIFQTHPASPERVTAALDSLKRAGIDYQPRAVNGGKEIVVKEDDGSAGTMLLQMNGATLMTLAPGENNAANKARAEATAQKINELMKVGLRNHELIVSGEKDDVALVARGIELVRPTAADAVAAKVSRRQLAVQWKNNFTRLFWREAMFGGF